MVVGKRVCLIHEDNRLGTIESIKSPGVYRVNTDDDHQWDMGKDELVILQD